MEKPQKKKYSILSDWLDTAMERDARVIERLWRQKGSKVKGSLSRKDIGKILELKDRGRREELLFN